MRCATWNVLTLNNNAALPLLSKELNKLNINLAGLQETRLCDSGETLCDGFHYLWSGRTDGKHYAGVGLAMNTQLLNKPCDATDAELQRGAEQATPDADAHTDLVTSSEVELCLKRIKNRRAPGICSITAELLKKGGDSMI